MRKIILASRSKARQKLLRQIGLKFRVAVSDIKEKRLATSSCKHLVVENALAKALDVATRSKNGIVIAADTIVFVNGKIAGKPKNMKDAFSMLKTLSRKPQWVYTGIAVVDIDRAKVLTDYEKTRVYMIHLSDSEIRSYFKKVSPLDKAGSFDIQGFGGIFIDRIEGI